MQTLRLTLEASRGENQALRQELDRLLSVGRVRARAPSPAVHGEEPAPPISPPADDPQLHEITKRLGDSLARFGAGDRSGMQTAAGDIFALVRRGKGALPALLDLYASATSPEAKKILLAPLLFIGGAEGRDFVMSQAATETDPALRKVLLDQSAKYATPDVADRAQGTFLERLQSDEDASTRLIAVRGLRYAQGADVQAALLRAAEDQDERVRLAAMDVLASRPAMRKRLREIASGDPSAHVREVAQCRLMVADNMP
jgi:HEAT repeat protein